VYEEIKRLEGWLTFPEAARYLGISPQALHKMVWESHEFPQADLRAVGDRPTYLIRTAAVRRRHAARERAKDERREQVADRSLPDPVVRRLA
jgi:hypothetical protein